MRKYSLFFMLFCSLAVCANPSIIVKKAELTRVSTQIQQLQKNITQVQEAQQNVEKELQGTETTIGEVSQQINSLNQSIAKEQSQLSKLKSAQQVSLKKLNQQYAALGEQVRAAYRLGQSHPLKIILNHDAPNTLQRHLNYYHHLMAARLQLIATTQQTLSELKSIVQSITQYQQRLKSLLTQKQTQQNQQKIAQNHRQQLLMTLHQSVQTKQQQLTSLISNQKNLQGIITQLSLQAQNAIPGLPFNQLHGKLHWPLKGTFAANFGSPLDVGDQRLSGIIIKAAQGTPVRAIYSGKVIFANWLRGFGLLLIINHGNNYMSLYGRNQALYAKVGTHVNTGDVIAAAGSTGGFDKASLYFEIRQNGTPVNPNLWCRY